MWKLLEYSISHREWKTCLPCFPEKKTLKLHEKEAGGLEKE